MSEAGHTERLEAALAGRYRIKRKLGEGGMAAVYLAEDLKHERKVALKILRPELAAVLGAERFLSEIKTTANLQHPHILPLFDSGEASGYLYYVMPYIDGETVRDKLDREKQLGVEESLRIASDVADALDYAHRQGVLHRDIKPGNILLHDGRPVVADFGIALAVSAAGRGRMTETGLSLGTPLYMSPEQASGERDLTTRSDVYSLGCVLYEMLAGQPPHTGPSVQSILVHILTEDPKPLDQLRRTVPPHVSAAVAKSIERLPADRFESAKGFMQALEDVRFRYQAKARASSDASARMPASASSPAGPWKRVSAALATMLAASLILAAWALLRPDAPESVSRQYVSTEGWAGLDLDFGILAALAPDGSSMVLPVEVGGATHQLGLKPRESEEVVPIPGTEDALSVVYSPDGLWIAYAVGTALRRQPIAGGSTVALADDVAPGTPGLAWLDDGTILYDQEIPGSTPTASVVRISEDGGEPLGVVLELQEIYFIQGLPGGRGALVIGCDRPGCQAESNNAYLVDLSDGSTEILQEQVVRAWYAPTGHVVYVRSDGAVIAAPFDLASLTPSASRVPLFDGVRVGTQRADMLLGADGRLLYVEAPSSSAPPGVQRLVVVDLEGNEVPLALTPRPIATVSWSPDGASLVFESEDHVYTYNVVLRTTPSQLTLEGVNRQPLFSPDGSRVAFSSFRDGTDGFDIFVKDLGDDSPPWLVANLPGGQYVTDWPMDTLIVFQHVPGPGTVSLWTADLSEPDTATVAPYLEAEPALRYMAVSPDGTLAAYRSDEGGAQEIHIRGFPVPGEPTLVWRSSTLSACCPAWSRGGDTLFFLDTLASAGANRTSILAARIQRDALPVVLSVDSLLTTSEGIARGFLGPGHLHPDGDRWILRQDVGSVGGERAEAAPDRLILIENWFTELRERTGAN